MVLNMVRQGVREKWFTVRAVTATTCGRSFAPGAKMRHYRFRNYLSRNCENYPTHELGPIAKCWTSTAATVWLTLVSVSSKARGLHEYCCGKKARIRACNKQFAQGTW